MQKNLTSEDMAQILAQKIDESRAEADELLAQFDELIEVGATEEADIAKHYASIASHEEQVVWDIARKFSILNLTLQRTTYEVCPR